MRIDLIRHGVCLDDAFLRGQSPAELSLHGKKQMLSIFSSLVGSDKPDWVVVSPAKRCLKPVELFYLNDEEEGTRVIVCADLQERNFGRWDGLSYDAIKSLDNTGLQGYLSNPFDYTIDQSEPFAVFERRILVAFEKLLKEASIESVDHMLIVTHGGVMRVLLKHILGLNNKALFQLEVGFAARMTLKLFALESVECEVVNAPLFPKGYFIKLVELVQSKV